MNKANLKSYAPKARLDFIKAVTERANVLGISAAGVVRAEVRGDVALIDGREWHAKLAGQRDELIARIKRHGFEQTMDEVAYTWFNRFAALRYMEIHDYLSHGWRVLSSRDEGLPEILRHASEVTLPGLNADRAREMQLTGNQDNELYKLLLVAQCNQLSRVMPFLFERIDDETELLLPENLLRTDSIVAKLVEQVPEEDWREIEVIGWLYQFYISEKKDQVIGKVVKSEDIPAATQLFTPNWIAQYLVQNSVGRQWIMANPTSTLASQWPYYIQPAEQMPEVQAQLDALIQTRINKDGEALNPETITVLDPACGSGHLLVVAYDVLKAIYLERGYQPRSIPRIILEKNLYGLDIDDRAVQLTAFALMMKARADDRSLFKNAPSLNVLSLQETNKLNVDDISSHLSAFGLQRASIDALCASFAHAKTFGSLITIPHTSCAQLATMMEFSQHALASGDLYAQQAAKDILPIIWQAKLLSMRFDAVVVNPPYMGLKAMNPMLKSFAKDKYINSGSDLFAMFIAQASSRLNDSGIASLVTMQSWMFLSSFSSFRLSFIESKQLLNCIHLGAHAFPDISGQAVQVAAFSVYPTEIAHFMPTFIKADSGVSEEKSIAIRLKKKKFEKYRQRDFLNVPGARFAYWITEEQLRTFKSKDQLRDILDPRQGMATSDNSRFLRCWWEVDSSNTARGCSDADAALKSGRRWFPYNKGGSPIRWAGNQEFVVNYGLGGQDLLSYARHLYGSPTRTIKNIPFYFREGITWGDITFKNKKGEECFAARHTPQGAVFDVKGSSGFPRSENLIPLLCLLNSKVLRAYMSFLNPTSTFQVGDIKEIPYIISSTAAASLQKIGRAAVKLANDSYVTEETCPAFLNFVVWGSSGNELQTAADVFIYEAAQRIACQSDNESEINKILADEYGLSGEIDGTISPEEITLRRPTLADVGQQFLSVAIGCMMGRYSLDEPGLIYAHARNIGFEPSRYSRFRADEDGIVPVTSENWFADAAACRVSEFLCAVFGVGRLQENLAWLAASLGIKGVETPDETIRRYLADKFYKDHLQTYRKRPIYWLFSSGKQGAFQALVYLHRYNDSTLARIRAEYVVPLIAKMASRLDMLDKDVVVALSAATRTKLQKQIESLRKKQIELLTYDEKLRHYSDMRITLDLDDGVKVNYAKFGDLVAESKAITGGSDE